MKIYRFLVFMFLGIVFNSPQTFAQKESYNWYFGANAGITFNTDPPTALTNGAINTTEGCSSISDDKGNLLFYTDGMTVWNKNHQVMDNGSGLNGDNRSTQSAVVIKLPESNSLYYIFTASEQGGN